MADTPVVLLTGARQVGKSTLAREYADLHSLAYVTFDDPTVLAAARDGSAFLNGIGARAVIDEVQKAPWLFADIKLQVDRMREPGRYLLTGSTNVMLIPRLADSLAGRMEVLQLWPLSQGEIAGRRERFIDALFEGSAHEIVGEGENLSTLTDLLVIGGYPEALTRRDAERRAAWHSAYVRTLVERDVRDLANIEGLVDIPRLLALLAVRVGSLMNLAEISRSIGIAQTTLKRYLALLEGVFLFTPVPAWHANLGKRLIKTPKVQLADCGLAAYLARYDKHRLEDDRNFFGRLLETFVVAELRKQAGHADANPDLYYYRTSGGHEVDVVLEDRRGRVIGIEIKASSTLSSRDFDALRGFGEIVGQQFSGGVILYGGTEILPFGERLSAMPVSFLWRLT